MCSIRKDLEYTPEVLTDPPKYDADCLVTSKVADDAFDPHYVDSTELLAELRGYLEHSGDLGPCALLQTLSVQVTQIGHHWKVPRFRGWVRLDTRKIGLMGRGDWRTLC